MAARLGAYLYFFNIEISPKKIRSNIFGTEYNCRPKILSTTLRF